MVRYRYLGSATTDNNGQATINYTGQGLGDIDIVASTDDSSTISAESVQSDPFNIEDYNWIATTMECSQETYIAEVGDTIAINVALKDQYDRGIVGETVKLSTDENKFIDKAVTGAKNTNWTGDGVEVTVGASNTTLAIESGEYYLANPYLKGDFEIVFDAVMSDTIRFRLVGDGKSCSIQANTTGKYRIKRIGGVFTFERSTDNGSTWTAIIPRETDTLTTETCRFSFYNLINAERTMSYSNFSMIYYSKYTSNTNSQGIASFSISDLSESGVYSFEASYGSLSAECTVINSMFYDAMTTDSSRLGYNNTLIQPVWSNEGCHVSAVSGASSGGGLQIKINNSTHPFDGTSDFTVEFDFKSANLVALYLYNNDGSQKNVMSFNNNNWTHIKWEYNATNKVIVPYLDGEMQSTVDLSSTNLTTFGFGVVDWQTDADYWIKNITIYKGGGII